MFYIKIAISIAIGVSLGLFIYNEKEKALALAKMSLNFVWKWIRIIGKWVLRAVGIGLVIRLIYSFIENLGWDFIREQFAINILKPLEFIGMFLGIFIVINIPFFILLWLSDKEKKWREKRKEKEERSKKSD